MPMPMLCEQATIAPPRASRDSSSPRVASLARTGRTVVIRQPGGLGFVDALGTAPRVSLACDDVVDFACVGTSLWLVTSSELRLYSLDSGSQLEPVLQLDGIDATLVGALGHSARSVAVTTPTERFLVTNQDGKLNRTDLGDDMSAAFVCPIDGLRVLTVSERTLRVLDVGRRDVTRARLPRGSEILGGGVLFGGRAFSLVTRDAAGDALVVVRSTGSLIHDISMPQVRHHAIAENRGLGLVHVHPNKLLAVDLRYGRVLGVTDPPIDLVGVEVDADAKFVVLAGFAKGKDELQVLHFSYTELFGQALTVGGVAVPLTANDGVPNTGNSGTGESLASIGTGHEQLAEDAASGDKLDVPDMPETGSHGPDDSEYCDEPVLVPKLIPLAFGPRPAPLQVTSASDIAPHESADDHLDDMLDFVAARAARAIAEAWDSGRLSLPSQDVLPFEREVCAIVGERTSGAGDHLVAAQRRLEHMGATVNTRTQASLAAGMRLPLVELVREFDLSFVAGQILLIVAAPAMRGDIARLYGVLSNDEGRAVCDSHLVQTLLASDDRRLRREIVRELAADAPLVRYGLVDVAHSDASGRLFASLAVDQVLINRLEATPEAQATGSAVSELYVADRSLADLVIPPTVKRDAVVALACPRDRQEPIRMVVRGRSGTGRRAFIAALAARVDRPLAVIDMDRLPRMGERRAARLRLELRRAQLRGAIPCVTGMSEFEGDGDSLHHVRDVLRNHPGPITFRAAPQSKPPLAPGYLSFTLPMLSETERLVCWRNTAAAHGLAATGLERLAGRFRIGPGTIETIANVTSRRRATATDVPPDATASLDQVAQQHIVARIGDVATRVTRLARWEQVVLPDDTLDSIREFIGRANHRRVVYDQWGFDEKMATSRGLTALFHGVPGTGKSMVAGLVARELGLDLYRVDLARISSKWIGETEKNLAQIFDAAEDGQVAILFDEADSLFAKRSEVKSSVDRYANLEVNYLLQRLDSFNGVAMLTTNLAGSLDTAFKRRLSLRLSFPFPNKDMRVQLWAAHVPPQVPTKGDFDFEDLATKFPISGSYIRNSTLRAAFLAAQEQVPLGQQHLVRAVHLEYREMGKLSQGGRLE